MTRRQDQSGLDSDKGSRSDRNSNSVFMRLQGKLQLLDFRSFQNCVWLWLGAHNYSPIWKLARHHRRGRRQDGGADFIIQVADFGEVRCAVQVRHWRTPVSRQAVDELRGYLLRHNVPAGMIVASSSFSRAAERAAADFPGRPIRLVGVSQLARSMMALDLGIRTWLGQVLVDERFFRTLKAIRSAGARPLERPLTVGAKRPFLLPIAEAVFGSNKPDNDGAGLIGWIVFGWLVFAVCLAVHYGWRIGG